MDIEEGSSDCKQTKVVGTSYRRPEARSSASSETTTIPTTPATKATPQQTKVTVLKATTRGTPLSVPNHTVFVSANAPTRCAQATPVIESALSGNSTPFAFSVAEAADGSSSASHTAQTLPTTYTSVSPVINSAISPIYPRGPAHRLGGKGLNGEEVVAADRTVAFWKVSTAGTAETSSCPSEQPSPVVLQQDPIGSNGCTISGGGVFSSGNQARIAATRGRGLGVKITLDQQERATSSTTVDSLSHQTKEDAQDGEQKVYVPLTLSNPARRVLPTDDDDIVIVKGIGKHVSRSEAYAAAARAVAASSASERSSSCVNTSASESEDTLKKESIARHATKASDVKAPANGENHTSSVQKSKTKEKKIFGNKKRTYEIPIGGANTSQQSGGKTTNDSGSGVGPPTTATTDTTSSCTAFSEKSNRHQIAAGDKKELTEQLPPQSLLPDNSNSSVPSTPKIRYGTAVEEPKVSGPLGKVKNEPKNPRRQALPLPEGHVEVPLVRPRYERKTRTTNQITVGDYASDSNTLGTVSDMIHQTSVEKLSIRHGDNFYEGTINFHTYSVFRHGARKIIARSVGYASEGDLVFHRFDVGEKSDSNNDSFAVIKRKTTEIHDAVCLDHRARRPMTDGEEEYLRKTKQINRKKNRKYPGIKAPKNKKIRQRLENDAITASSDFKLAFARAERRLAEERRERRKQRLAGANREGDSCASSSSGNSSDASLDECGRLRPKARGTFQNVPPRYHKLMHQEEEKQNAYLESVGVSTNTMHHTSAAKATPVSGPVDPNSADARFSLLNTRLRDESKRALVSEYLTGLIAELDQDFTDYIRFSVPMVASQTPPFGPATPPYASMLPPPGGPSSSGTSPTSLLGVPAFAALPSSAGSSFAFPTKTIADRSGFASRSSNANAAVRGNTQSLLSGRAATSSSVVEDEAKPINHTTVDIINDSNPQKLPPAANVQNSTYTDANTDANPAPTSSFASVTHAATNRVCSAAAHSTGNNNIGGTSSSPTSSSSLPLHLSNTKQQQQQEQSFHYRFPSTPPSAPLTAPPAHTCASVGGGGPLGSGSPMPSFLGEQLNQHRLTTPPSTTQIERVADALPDNAPPPLSYAFRDGYGRLICHAVATYYKLLSTSEEDPTTGSRKTVVQFPESKRARAMALALPSMPFLQYLKVKTRNHSAASTTSVVASQMAAFAVGGALSPTSSPIPSTMGMMVHANTMPPPLFEEEDENAVEGGQGCDYTQCPAALTLIGGVDADGQTLTKTAVKKLKKEIKLFELACSRGVEITQQQVEEDETAVDEKAKRRHKKKRCSQQRNSKQNSQAFD